jgi:hypothetical protein
VLLRGVGGVGLACLVRRDRLVLDAVVGGDLAAAQREQGRSERDHPRGRLAADAAQAPARQRPATEAPAATPITEAVLERQLRLRQRA